MMNIGAQCAPIFVEAGGVGGSWHEEHGRDRQALARLRRKKVVVARGSLCDGRVVYEEHLLSAPLDLDSSNYRRLTPRAFSRRFGVRSTRTFYHPAACGPFLCALAADLGGT